MTSRIKGAYLNVAIINSLITVAAEEITYGQKIANGLVVVVVGMLAIFAVLGALMCVLSLFKVFFYDIPEKKKAALKAKQEQVKLNSSEIVPVIIGSESSTTESEDDSQLIAVITAAVAAYIADSEKSVLPFRVVSYKRLRGANGWNGADENETV